MDYVDDIAGPQESSLKHGLHGKIAQWCTKPRQLGKTGEEFEQRETKTAPKHTIHHSCPPASQPRLHICLRTRCVCKSCIPLPHAAVFTPFTYNYQCPAAYGSGRLVQRDSCNSQLRFYNHCCRYRQPFSFLQCLHAAQNRFILRWGHSSLNSLLCSFKLTWHSLTQQ